MPNIFQINLNFIQWLWRPILGIRFLGSPSYLVKNDPAVSESVFPVMWMFRSVTVPSGEAQQISLWYSRLTISTYNFWSVYFCHCWNTAFLYEPTGLVLGTSSLSLLSSEVTDVQHLGFQYPLFVSSVTDSQHLFPVEAHTKVFNELPMHHKTLSPSMLGVLSLCQALPWCGHSVSSWFLSCFLLCLTNFRCLTPHPPLSPIF